MARSSNSSDKTLPLIIQTELVTESSVPEIAEKTVKQVVLDWGVRRVCSRAFSRCGSLKDLFVSATVHTIEEGAFAACTHLERVQFSDGIQEIGDRAFSSCRFTELSLPDTIRKLGAGCPSRMGQRSAGQSLPWMLVSGGNYTASEAETHWAPCLR